MLHCSVIWLTAVTIPFLAIPTFLVIKPSLELLAIVLNDLQVWLACFNADRNSMDIQQKLNKISIS